MLLTPDMSLLDFLESQKSTKLFSIESIDTVISRDATDKYWLVTHYSPVEGETHVGTIYKGDSEIQALITFLSLLSAESKT